MFKNEHDLFMPVLFDTCLCYDSCQSSFKWEAVCYKQITLLSMKGEKQTKTLVGLSTERVRIQASLNSEFPGCFLWKRLCSHILMVQSSEQWQSGLAQLCLGCMGSLKIPEVIYEVFVFLMDLFHHCCVFSLQARGRCPQHCVHQDSSGGIQRQ